MYVDIYQKKNIYSTHILHIYTYVYLDIFYTYKMCKPRPKKSILSHYFLRNNERKIIQKDRVESKKCNYNQDASLH